jgi:putative ABC transport system ATP-binding protein
MAAVRKAPPAPEGAVVVEARDLRKVYDTGSQPVEALRGSTLAVRQGELLSIMGPSGCGKTTLLNCLSGLDEPTGGSVRIEGHDLAAMGDDERTRFRGRRLGFVFQSYNLLPVLSAEENVMLPLLVQGMAEDAARAKAREAMEDVGIAHRASHLPRELSGGEQQRAAIARALVNAPAIVFADEPTGNLDSTKGSQILALLRDLNRHRGLTLVVVTHDTKVAEVSHRVLRMDSGAIVGEERGGAVLARGKAR